MQPAAILEGDALAKLRELPDACAQTCVTSPPYWGLRDYQTGSWRGGDPAHEHDRVLNRAGRGGSGTDSKRSSFPRTVPARSCACGATYEDHQLGLEATVEEWVGRLVEVFREVRRVLRPDGTLWVNVGDSYATQLFTRQGRPRNVPQPPADWNGTAIGGNLRRRDHVALVERHELAGLKPKDLIGQPWALAFALRADGWWLRRDVVWNKPNPVPESATDRPSCDHEYVFLLSPSARYYYDADAVRQGAAYGYCENRGGGDLWTPAGSAGPKKPRRARRTSTARETEGATRNLRTVWYFPTRPSPYAHFATFPEELPELAIRASTSELGACAACGTPWRRVVKRSGVVVGRDWNPRPRTDAKRRHSLDPQSAHGGYRREEVGWRRGCGCDTEERRPCVVLDPVVGSGTTGVVARRLGRHFLGIELSSRYAAIARGRLGLEGGPDPGPLFEPRPPLSA